MKAGWIGAIIFIWVIAIILGSITAGENLLANPDVTASAQSPLSFVQVWSEEGWGTLVNPIHWPGFFSDIWALATLDVPLFGESDSPYQLVRWIILAPIIGTLVFALVILFISMLRRTI